jgi:SAM-dependent methyltransferase
MEELIKRGYQYTGLDLNQAMLKYSREKASRINAKVNLIQGDMLDFSLVRKVDFIYILLGSLCAKNTSELIAHFDSVAKALKKGGLYLLDWCIQYPPWRVESENSWEMEKGDIKVKTTVSWKSINKAEQTFEEIIVFEIDDHGEKLNITGTDLKRAIYPQEFLFFISNHKHFEFVGWWNNWNLKEPLEQVEKIDRPIALVRRL